MRLRVTLSVFVIVVVLTSCAAKHPPSTALVTWTLPLSANDQDRICVIVMDYPGRRCTTAGELRSFVRSVKAN